MSESELFYDWRFTANQFVLATSPLRLTTRKFVFQLNTCGYSFHVTSSRHRGWVSRLQLLLVLASAVILRFDFRRTHDHILLSQIRDSPNLKGQVPVFVSPKNWFTTAIEIPETRLCPREITGKYEIKILIKHAHLWNWDRKGGRNWCYKSSQQTKSVNTNA
jgi:hypothetical protein